VGLGVYRGIGGPSLTSMFGRLPGDIYYQSDSVVFFFPIVLFAGFSFSWSASQYLYINLDQSQTFQPPPYLFSPLIVGMTNWAVFGGALIGLFTAGPLSDWFSQRQTDRNNGVREPEMRLPTLIPYLICAVIGNVIASVGADNSWPWEAIVIVGYGCIGIQVAAIPAIAITYAIDSYKPVSGQVLITATITKNLWGYGVSQYVNAWIEQVGYVIPTMMNMGLLLLFSGVGGALLYFFGKRVRHWTRNDGVHSMH